MKKVNNRPIIVMAVLVIIIIALGMVLMIYRYSPTSERMKLKDYYKVSGNKAALIFDGEYLNDEEGKAAGALIFDGKIYISLNFLKDKLDDTYVYDSEAKILRYVTDKDVYSINAGEKTYTVGSETRNNKNVIVYDHDGTAYIDPDFASLLTDFKYSTASSPARIIIKKAGWKYQEADVKRDTQVRRFGGVKSLILSELSKKSKVTVLENYGKWSKIVTDDGVIGCVLNSTLRNNSEKKVQKTLEKRTYKHKKLDGKVNLAWCQVTNKSANQNALSYIDKMKGVNVISPTWFYIADGSGNIGNRSSLDFVNTCHAKNIQVWGLISNFENSDIDVSSAINRTASRDNLVNQTLAAAIAADLDGINVDFESISEKDKDGYLEFIRELSLKCEKNDIILSVDNYVPTQYTAFYDRANQADFADYIIMMAYDEHYAGSKEAGSNSSFPFVSNGIKDTLKEVPSDQIVLGLPLYTRIWCTENGKVTSKPLAMDKAVQEMQSKGAEVKWLEKEQQNYAEYIDGDKLYQCWIEDEKSLTLKLKLVQDDNLAGAAFWKMGLEDPDIWNAISTYLE